MTLQDFRALVDKHLPDGMKCIEPDEPYEGVMVKCESGNRQHFLRMQVDISILDDNWMAVIDIESAAVSIATFLMRARGELAWAD